MFLLGSESEKIVFSKILNVDKFREMLIKINLRNVALLAQSRNVCVRKISKYVLKVRNCGYGVRIYRGN
jgi:hypothetical protein